MIFSLLILAVFLFWKEKYSTEAYTERTQKRASRRIAVLINSFVKIIPFFQSFQFNIFYNGSVAAESCAE